MLFYLTAAAVILLIGLSKGGLGGVIGAAATPLMALVMPADEVIGLLLPLLMLGDIFAVTLHWGHWDQRLTLLLLPGAVVGVTLGTYFITNTPTETLRLGLGIIVLLFALYKLLESRILRGLTYQNRSWHGLLAGTAAGFSSALAHTGGPPISIYLLMQQLPPRVFVGTIALFFMLVNWIKVPYYFYADLFDIQQLWRVVWVIPLLPLGVWLGRWLVTRIERQTFERIIVMLLAVTAVLLIFT